MKKPYKVGDKIKFNFDLMGLYDDIRSAKIVKVNEVITYEYTLKTSDGKKHYWHDDRTKFREENKNG